jgi:N-acylethanolamine-hydrolysing acid amidase
MRNALFALTLIGLLIGQVSGFHAVPKFELDLDKHPEDRWKEAVKIVVSKHGWDHTFGPAMSMIEALHFVLPPSTFQIMEDVMRTNFPTNYAEARGLAKAIADLGYPQYGNTTFLIPIPYMYELQHINTSSSSSDISSRLAKLPKAFRRACTGILSLPEDPNATIVHGRNLDESPHSMRNLTLDITVKRNGTYQYSIFDYTWVTTGFYTGSRKCDRNGLTLEENWRDYDNPSYEVLMGRIQSKGFVPVALMFREVMEQSLSFDQAISYITTVNLGSPAYVIMSGSQRQGAILTLFWNASHNVQEHLDDSSHVTFKVQTNYDRWLPDPTDDPRRTVAEKALTAVGRHRSGTEWGVWMALSTYPVHDVQTLFTVLMRPDKDPEGFIRDAMIPAS